MLDDAHLNSVVGNQSSPNVVPKIQDAWIHVYPLNSNFDKNNYPFVVCISTWWVSKNRNMQPEISYIPAKIKLTLANGTVLTPSGFSYNFHSKCPYPELGNLRQPLVFERLKDTSIATTNDVGSAGYQDVAFSFDIATPKPDEQFTIELNSIKIDSLDFPVNDKVTFKNYYGAIPVR